MTGNYKIYKLGPNYESLKDQIIKAWRFYSCPSAITCSQKFLQNLDIGVAINTTFQAKCTGWEDWKRDKHSTSFLSLLNRSFTAMGKVPPTWIITSQTWISHIFCCWCIGNDLVCHLRAWKICKACKLESVSWGSA